MVETIRLESGHTLTGIVGSNPTLSAIAFVFNKIFRGDTGRDTEITERRHMNREVNVTKRVLTAKGPRFCPVVRAANGRIKPYAVRVNGIPEKRP